MVAELRTDDAQRFDLPRAYRRQQAFLAAGSLTLAGLLVAAVAFEPDLRDSALPMAIVLSVFAFFVGGALYSLRISRGRHHGVEIARDGIRPLGGDAARTVGWAEISELRVRQVLQRLELCSPGGEVRARLEFQLERFEEALAAVLAHLPAAPMLALQGSHLEVRRPPAERLTILAVVASMGAIAAWSSEHRDLILWLGFPVMVVAAATDYFTLAQRIEVRGGRLLFHARARSKEVDLAEVERARLRLRAISEGVKGLAVELRYRGGRVEFLPRSSADPFALLRLVQGGLDDLRRERERSGAR